MKDLIIIGAGPAGLATAIEAKRHQLDYIIFDKANVVNTIIQYPTDMIFNSTSELLELGGLPFNSNQMRPTRREAVRYFQRVARHFGLDIRPYHEFFALDYKDEGYSLHFRHTIRTTEFTENSRNVVIATGFYDVPKRLDVPGKDLPHVRHYYREAFPYHDQDVVIVGAGNSAVEAALDIFRNGGRVTMIHRGDRVKKGVKYWILPDILNRIREKSIRLIANAKVIGISADTVAYERKGKRGEANADHVLALTGYQPDRSILERTGAAFDALTLEPRVDPASFESSRPGLYFAGSMLAGIYPNRIFIENARGHGEVIIKHILSQKR